MEFSCYKDDLIAALKAAMPAVSVKPQSPVLSGIYINAEGNTIELQSYNFTKGVIVKSPCSVEQSGEVVVGGKKFQEVVSKLAGNTLTCKIRNNMLDIQAGGADISLLTMNAADFPKVKTVDSQNTFKIRTAVLYDLIRKTVFATAEKTEGTRPIFTGVNFEFHDNLLTLAATNTHRISIAKTQIALEHEPFSFVVPADALFTLLGNINPKDTDNCVTISFTGNFVAFTFDNVYMTARLIEGQFPPYQKIIPTGSTTRVQVNPAEFKQALEIVALMAKETEYNTVKLNFHHNMIELFANSGENGSAEQIITADIDGEDLGIAFNYRYLTDVLRLVDAPNINIAFNDHFSPALVTVPGNDNFLYVVTPVRT